MFTEYLYVPELKSPPGRVGDIKNQSIKKKILNSDILKIKLNLTFVKSPPEAQNSEHVYCIHLLRSPVLLLTPLDLYP